jgi:hypothetical protein
MVIYVAVFFCKPHGIQFFSPSFPLMPFGANFYQIKSTAEIQEISYLRRKTVFESTNKNEAAAFLGYGIVILKYIKSKGV